MPSANSKGPQMYPHLMRVDVPQVKYGKLSWAQQFAQAFRRIFMPTMSEDFMKKANYFPQKFKEQVKGYSELRKETKQIYLRSRAHRCAIRTELMGSLNFGHAPHQWDDEVEHVQAILDWVPGQHIPIVDLPRPSAQYEEDKEDQGGAGFSVDNEGRLALPPTNAIADKHSTPSDRVYGVINVIPQGKTDTGRMTAEQVGLLSQYCDSIQRTKALRTHLEDIEKDLENYAFLVRTQAVAEFTFFRGLRDWAQIMLQLVDSLTTALIAISTLGAGLVYATIFSATRGDLGLMCYTFPFFSLGFLIPVVIQIGTRWAAALQQEVKFASQRFWTLAIGVSLFISSLAVMASITILNLTIFFLEPVPDDPIQNNATSVPGIVAFGISGSVFVLVFMAFVLAAIATKAFSTARGFKALIGAMYGIQAHHEDALKVYLPV